MTKHLTRAGLGLGLFAALRSSPPGAASKTGPATRRTRTRTSRSPRARSDEKGDDTEQRLVVRRARHPGGTTAALCSAKVAAEYKKKGDWCKEHDRAKSQCFICNPKLKEKYAAEYRAKYGKEPPPIDPENIKGGKAKEGEKEGEKKGEKK